MIIIKTRSEVKVKVTVTRKWYATLRHPKMYPHTKFGIPNSKNIGDMDRTRKRDGRTDGRTDGLTDGRTVRLLYASQSSFGGIKITKRLLKYEYDFFQCDARYYFQLSETDPYLYILSNTFMQNINYCSVAFHFCSVYKVNIHILCFCYEVILVTQ